MHSTDWNGCRLSSPAIVTLQLRNESHNPNQINKRPTFGTAALIFISDNYMVVVKIESNCEMSPDLSGGEGKIERISLSGKFRRARMA